MLSRRFVKHVFLVAALAPALVQSDALLRGTVESLRDAKAVSMEGTPLASGRLLADFYGARDYQAAWTRPDQVEGLLQAAQHSATEGLAPRDFHLDLLRELARPGALARLSPSQRVAAEIRLSDALLRYVYQIRFGRLDPVQINRVWNHRPAVPAQTLIHSMESVVSATDPAARLATLAPRPFFYEDLKRALRNYGDAEHLKNLTSIPAGANLAEGSRGPRVILLRERLRVLGDHTAPDPDDPERFEAPLRKSLIAFQRRFGLSADGVAGPSTLAALNHPYDSAKADTIRINLERMRWFYDDLPPDYVLVDVAGFMVEVIRDRTVRWSTRVVVGTSEQQTPSFRDEMEHLVFNPTWTVPPSIQKKMRGVSSRYKVVDRRTGRTVRGGNVSDHRRYRLVQQAGPGNALGRVKFIFPNGHAIYLHDTPSKSLFSRKTRAYSHGCVRVQNPFKLAEVILDKPSWNQSEINRVVGTNRTRYVQLADHLPVILYYLTAKTDPDGKLSFRPDIYGRDSALMRAIDGPPSPLRIAFPKPEPIPETIPATESPSVEAKSAVEPPAATAPQAGPATLPQPQETPATRDTEPGPPAPPAVTPAPGTTVTLDIESPNTAPRLDTNAATVRRSDDALGTRSVTRL